MLSTRKIGGVKIGLSIMTPFSYLSICNHDSCQYNIHYYSNLCTEGWGRFKPRLKNQSRNYFYIKLGIFELWNDHKLKSYKFKIWEKSSKMWILMKFQGSNRGPLECETNALPLHYFYAWAAQKKKLSFYKCNIHFCQENIEWSGKGVEQKSGISHLFNLLNFEFLGFQFLVI